MDVRGAAGAESTAPRGPRSTAAISVLGPRFSSGHFLSRPVRQPAPGGALVVTPKWSPEGLPGPGVRDLCAGAAPCSISRTPPEDALSEQDERVLAYVPVRVNNIPYNKFPCSF